MKPSSGGRRLRRATHASRPFAQAAGTPGGAVGWCAARIRALGLREVAQAASLA
jgi:hypothetical protein